MADDVDAMLNRSLEDRLLSYMARLPVSYTVGELSAAMTLPVHEVQAELHRLDDEGKVTMRNGWYQLSAAELARRDKQPAPR